MTKTNLEIIQNIELEILDEFIRICKKYDLKYFLIGGSCIGAVRHEGMIPWDDDIDVGMPRTDYEKLIEISHKEFKDKYFFQHFKSEKNCGLIFGKIRKNNTILSENYSHHIKMNQGVWIDIFPYDNISDNNFVRRLDRTLLAIYQNIYIVKCDYKMPENRSKFLYVFYYLTKFISSFISLNFLVNKLDKIMKKHNGKNTESIYLYGGAYKEKDIMPSSIIEDTMEYNFNGRKATIYRDFDYYLSKLYGDYMQLPPEDKRNSGAHFVHEFKEKVE